MTTTNPPSNIDPTEPPRTLRYGIIGCGSMGREHIENIRALGHARVTAIADTHPGSRSAAQAVCTAGGAMRW